MSAPETVVVTTSSLAAPAMELLNARGLRLIFLPISTSPGELTEILARENPHGIISRAIGLDASAISAAPALKVISKYGVGYDNVDIEAARARDVPVLITRGANSQSVAEMAIGHMISLARNFRILDREVRAGQWIRTIDRGLELAGLTLGIVGYGAIGRRVARIAEAIGMKVHIYDPFVAASSVPSSICRQATLEQLLECANVLSLHCPLTHETRNLLDADRLSRLQPGALVINTARGEVVDDEAMADALRRGHLWGYAADTFSVEPPLHDNPLLGLDNTQLTPHCGAATRSAANRVAEAVTRNLLLGLDGKGWESEDVVNRTPQA
jgi:D-3-phosphoglycerate dehydrogenase